MAAKGNAPRCIEHRAYARVGLLGNPSDLYFGRTISFSIGNFWASVRLEPSENLVIRPHPKHDLVSFDSLRHLVCRLQNEGYYGGAGLSGSSAIVCAALNCLLDFYKVRHLVKVQIRPDLILSAERELGIVAGLQDRVAQVYGGLVYMDFSKENIDKLGHGIYIPMDIDLLPPLHLIYAENPSDSGKVHSTVHKRWLDGDQFIISSMEEVAKIALDGHKALTERNNSELAKLMNSNFDLRRKMFGDDVLGALNIQMVATARGVGAAAKFTGSGGAVVVFCSEGPEQVKLLEDACLKAGFVVQPIIVVPSVLTDEDLLMISS
ncbi:glucuronokinase 1-like isoform X2 [Phalaenopsis equestris]|uniref:glucuronokinase 1-like isoform X2 n=1 Tax=Phalaenopsis equestris TaxID=78828 RepID=UPI0009E19C79|nr:glucuronokinase 1-like isoform X2 [Phalaenopsis equestris]